jgi:predicted ATP-grasp superfamily ATP-dependent carboligase
MSAEHNTLLILGNSGRAMAESAVRGGYQVTVVDGFCDQDTLAIADCWPVSQGFQQLDLDIFIDEIVSNLPKQACGMVYGAGLEESTELLSRLKQSFPLLGNDHSVLEILRKPRRFFSLLNRLRIPYPEVSFTPPYSDTKNTWLIKRAGSCGGQGVAYFDPNHSAADCHCYYQRYVSGQTMSVLFIADGKRQRTIGYNRLGMSVTNAPAPFLYSGAIGQASVSSAQRQRLDVIVDRLVSELALRGVNSLDFVLKDGEIFAIDLNPRPTATLDLYEHLLSDGWIKHHIRACQGELPVLPIVASAVVHGQQIVYAPRTLQIPLSMNWPSWVKDRPVSGARIMQGQPLCSLYADGASAEKVEILLQCYQDDILQMLGTHTCQPQQRRVVV